MRLSVIVEPDKVGDLAVATVMKTEGVWLNSEGINIFIPAAIVDDLYRTCAGFLLSQSDALKLSEKLNRLVYLSPQLFNEFETNFIPSIHEQLKDGKNITPLQKSKLKETAAKQQEALANLADSEIDPNDDIPF